MAGGSDPRLVVVALFLLDLLVLMLIYRLVEAIVMYLK